jgi:hypothetical protein
MRLSFLPSPFICRTYRRSRILLSAGFAAVLPLTAHAVGTDPTLALTSATAVAAPGGAVSVSVDGTFSFDDVVQFSFPAGVIVFRGSDYAVFDIDGSVETGTSPAVANGISAAEIPALLAGGGAAAAPAALLRVQSNRIAVAMPGGFGAGSASVIVYAILEGEPFVSNTVGVTLP